MKYLLCLPLCLALVGCGAALTPADQTEIVDTASTIAKCEIAGKACQADAGDSGADCYGVYDACMKDGGL